MTDATVNNEATAEANTEPVQVSLLTGFLGGGKTTLLNKLVKHPDMVETAVLINEFGEMASITSLSSVSTKTPSC